MAPSDPQFHTRGEDGMYHDTPLGAIPTDAELAYRWQRTPTISTWTAGRQPDGSPIYWSNPWVPPTGWIAPPPAGASYSLNGLGEGEVDLEARAAAAAVSNELAKHQKRLFWLSTVSTAAVAVTAGIGLMKAFREARHRRSGGS